MRFAIEMGPEFDRTVAELGELGLDIIAATSRGLAVGGKGAASLVGEKYLSGQSLQTRSGNLKTEVTSWMTDPLEATVGVPENSVVANYAWILGDEEKLIRPKKGKYLTIPIAFNLTGTGRTRFESPRDVENGFFIESNGQLLFGTKRGKRGKFRPLFVLVKSVLVQGSGALIDGVMDSLDNIADSIKDEIGQIKDVN